MSRAGLLPPESHHGHSPKAGWSSPGDAARLDALDGFRALAVTLVVLYHYFYFWSSAGKGFHLLAYDDAWAWLPLASVGFLGVHLFFVVSGFVIFLTLEKTNSLRDFLVNRAIRLWPPLLLFGTVTFIVVRCWGPEQLKVGFWEYLLSIVILPPQHVAMLIGADGWKWLDGAYWSLWVEVKFYFLIGSMYFLRPGSALSLWTGYEVATIGIGAASGLGFGGRALEMVDGFLFQNYVPYFSFGIAAYMARTGRDCAQVRLLAGVAIAHLALLAILRLASSQHQDPIYFMQQLAGDIAILTLFYFFAWKDLTPKVFCYAPITRIGRASYGVYLLHQNVGLTILSLLVFAGALTGLLAATLTFLGVIVIAVASYGNFERPLQLWLRRRLSSPQSHASGPAAPLEASDSTRS